MLRQCLWLLLSRRTCLPQTMLVYRDEQPPWAVITNISCCLLDVVQTTSTNLLISQLLLPLDDELFILNPPVCSNHRLPIKSWIYPLGSHLFFFEDSTMALYLLSFCLLGIILGRIWTRGSSAKLSAYASMGPLYTDRWQLVLVTPKYTPYSSLSKTGFLGVVVSSDQHPASRSELLLNCKNDAATTNTTKSSSSVTQISWGETWLQFIYWEALDIFFVFCENTLRQFHKIKPSSQRLWLGCL